MKRTFAAVVLLISTVPTVAENRFDGLWKPVPIELPNGTKVNSYTCTPMEVDGATPIKGDWYGEMESDCTMANPTNVRGLGGTLFDVTCKGDWGSQATRQLFMLYRDHDDRERLLIVRPGGAEVFERCPSD